MRLLFPTLLLSALLQAQPNQVLYTGPGALDKYLAGQPKASVVSVDANGVTVKHEGSPGLTAITSPGLVYKNGDKWSISKPRIEALPNGAGWAVTGMPTPVRISGGNKAAKDLSVGAGGFTLSLPGVSYAGGADFTFLSDGRAWKLSVVPDGLAISTTVGSKQGPKKYSFDYNFTGASAVDNKGKFRAGTEIGITQPGIIGADHKPYPCTGWAV